MKSENPEIDDEFIRRFTNCQRDLRAFIVGMTPSRADADDVLQEVNLALWRKRHLYDPGQEFLRWAFGFAVIEIRNFRSRSSKHRMWFDVSVVESVAASWPGDPDIREQRRDALAACLRRLATIERRFISAFYGRQLSAQEIADESGRPLSSVYKILNRARESLRECVKRSMSQAHHPV